MTDQQVKLRSRKNPNLPKLGKPPPRTCSPPASHLRTPPNSNEQAPADPATVADSELGDIVMNDSDNGGEILESTTTAEPNAAGPQQVSGAGSPHLPADLVTYFKSATEKFEEMIRTSVNSFIKKLNDLETQLGASLEFERKRIDEMKTKQDEMNTKVQDMENEISVLKSRLDKQEEAANKNERFSRRNNVRLIGIPEPQEGQREDSIQIAEDVLRRKFDITSKTERAHRDGRKYEGKPRHILIKFLSYRDKVEVMRHAREALKNERYFIADDLTPLDLKEKQKWVKEVQDLYKSGTKLRFYAGKWRQLGGNAYIFK